MPVEEYEMGFKVAFLYQLQLISFIIQLGVVGFSLLAPGFLAAHLGFNTFEIIFGPMLLFLIHYMMIINVIITMYKLYDDLGRFYNPFMGKFMNLKKIFRNLGILQTDQLSCAKDLATHWK